MRIKCSSSMPVPRLARTASALRGRVLGVTGLGSSLRQARERAYTAADQIRFEGKHFRRDIGQE